MTTGEGEAFPSDRDWRPRPDPTRLTNEAIDRAAVAFRRELGALREILEARMASAEESRELLHQIVEERTHQIEQRFRERDVRFGERDEARQAAVRTALDAAKELSGARDAATTKATEKYEASVREQIAQLAAVAAASRDVLDSKIGALKERIDRGEGAGTGAQEHRTEQRLTISSAAGIISTIVAIVAVAVSIIIARGH